MKTYNVDILSETDLDSVDKMLYKLENLFDDNKFKEFLLNKSKKLLKNICEMNLPIESEASPIQNDYMNNMKTEITDDSIILYNDSVINIDEKNMSETTKAKYPAQLSLAKIIEFGIGYSGSQSILTSEAEDWEYDVNNHGVEGWYYKDDAGNIHWTNGFEGRFIFFKLAENIKQYIGDWIAEYIEINS